MIKVEFTTNIKEIAKEIQRSARRTEEEVEGIVHKYTRLAWGDVRRTAPARTSYLRRQVTMNYEDDGMTGIVKGNAHYTIHVEEGHMVYKGQLFPLIVKNKLEGWRRVKETRFIEGQHFFQEVYEKYADKFLDEIENKGTSHF